MRTDNVCRLAGFFLLALTVMHAARAVQLDSVYAAEVDIPARGGLDAAFDEALGKVLVKMTGLTALGTAAARKSLVANPGPLVSKYTRLPAQRVMVEFDGPALQRILDAAGQPVWGIERPLIALWYAVDPGNGNRLIVPAAADSVGRSAANVDALRVELLAAADDRGLPIVLPLLDAEDLGNVSFSDLWGDFREPVLAASSRYGAQAIMIGRARSLDPAARRVRWTLVTPTEQFAWEGSVAEGPERAADYLAQRFATFADAAGTLRLMVTNVDSLEKFGQLRKYLLSLDVIQGAAIARVEADRIEFDLVVRGDAGRLRRSLDAGRNLARFDAPLPAVGAAIRPVPDLVYTWSGAR